MSSRHFFLAYLQSHSEHPLGQNILQTTKYKTKINLAALFKLNTLKAQLLDCIPSIDLSFLHTQNITSFKSRHLNGTFARLQNLNTKQYQLILDLSKKEQCSFYEISNLFGPINSRIVSFFHNYWSERLDRLLAALSKGHLEQPACEINYLMNVVITKIVFSLDDSMIRILPDNMHFLMIPKSVLTAAELFIFQCGLISFFFGISIFQLMRFIRFDTRRWFA